VPSGIDQIVFPTKATLEKDWDDFVSRYGITDAEAYLAAAEMPYDCLSSLQIAIGTACNFNCPMCFNHYDKTYGYYIAKELTLEEAGKLIKQNAPMNDLAFAVSGEPFLHPQLFEILDMARPHARTFTFSTNASLITPDKIKKLRGYSIRRIFISADGSDKESYERFRKNGSYEVFRKRVRDLTEAFGNKIFIAATVFKENREALLHMPQLCHELGVRSIVIFRLFEHPHAAEKGVHKLTKREMRDFMVAFIRSCQGYGITPSWDTRAVDMHMAEFIRNATDGQYATDLGVYRSPCAIPFHNLLTDVEGNFNFCCSMEPIAGDSLNRSAKDLFNAREIRMMRVLNLLGRFPLMCRKYCGRIQDPSIEVSIQTLNQRMVSEKLEGLIWEETSGITPNSRVIVTPYGTLGRELVSRGSLRRSDLAAIIDREYRRYQEEAPDLRFCADKELPNLHYDALVLASASYWKEILYSLLKHDKRLASKKVYKIDLPERRLTHCVSPLPDIAG
jgi:MoaA/NifB/PqqE/SkfB family radical SAM enzyme